MERQEVKKLLMIIDAFYPPFGNVVDLKTKLDSWEMALQNQDFETAQALLLEHVKTEKYPPTVQKLSREIRTVMTAEETRDKLLNREAPPDAATEEERKAAHDKIRKLIQERWND